MEQEPPHPLPYVAGAPMKLEYLRELSIAVLSVAPGIINFSTSLDRIDGFRQVITAATLLLQFEELAAKTATEAAR